MINNTFINHYWYTKSVVTPICCLGDWKVVFLDWLSIKLLNINSKSRATEDYHPTDMFKVLVPPPNTRICTTWSIFAIFTKTLDWNFNINYYAQNDEEGEEEEEEEEEDEEQTRGRGGRGGRGERR